MKAFVLIADGEYTESINGVETTTKKLEPIVGFATQARADGVLVSRIYDVKEPSKWKSYAISVYSVEML